MAQPHKLVGKIVQCLAQGWAHRKGRVNNKACCLWDDREGVLSKPTHLEVVGSPGCQIILLIKQLQQHQQKDRGDGKLYKMEKVERASLPDLHLQPDYN